MNNISLADAKARLSELVERAAAGDSVTITRRGKPMARLVPIKLERKPIDASELRTLTDAMPRQTEPASALVRKMRDEDRY
jgi:prevent-host-death family protein